MVDVRAVILAVFGAAFCGLACAADSRPPEIPRRVKPEGAVVVGRFWHGWGVVDGWLVWRHVDTGVEFALGGVETSAGVRAFNLAPGRWQVTHLILDDKAFGFSRPVYVPVAAEDQWLEIRADATTFVGDWVVTKKHGTQIAMDVRMLDAAEKRFPEVFCCGRKLYAARLGGETLEVVD